MKRRPRFSTRLLVSYLVVVSVGAAVLIIVSRFVAPGEFQRRLRLSGQGRGPGGAQPNSDALEQLVADSLDVALVAGVAAAVVAAAIVAVLVSRRVVRPIDDVRLATAALARGEYDKRVPLPTDAELAALAEDVNTLAEELATTDQRRTRLMGEVAHELRSPLTTIEGTMEAILDGVREADDTTLALVAAEARRVHRLADDLTLLSQTEEGAVPLQLRAMDLAELAGDAVDRLRPQFDHKGVEVITDLGPAPAHADPDRMTQVCVNLLGNALTHTPAGGTVTVRSGSEGTVSFVEVIDTGVGIVPDQLPHIFERFYRIPDATRTAGRGIGLTIARSLARAHGGDVEASSPGSGKGATFRVTVPH
ncbi:MAG: HAMP domain-containing histidine kinase [Acidimicrobiia bacterium]|nr:HAMP domain-containing histidine kinase [Acidimicrobiia bacterium]